MTKQELKQLINTVLKEQHLTENTAHMSETVTELLQDANLLSHVKKTEKISNTQIRVYFGKSETLWSVAYKNQNLRTSPDVRLIGWAADWGFYIEFDNV